jgi:hypothetical protein
MLEALAADDACGSPPHVQVPLSTDLISRVWALPWVERLPPAAPVSRAALCNIDRCAVHERLQAWTIAIRHASAHNSASSAQAFCVNISLFLADPGLCESADDASRSTTSRGTGQRGCQPTGGHHWAQAGNGNEAESRKEAGGAPHGRSDASPRSGSLGAIISPVQVAIRISIDLAVRRIPIIRIAGEDADVTVSNASVLEGAHCCSRVLVIVVKAGNRNGHKLLLNSGRLSNR